MAENNIGVNSAKYYSVDDRKVFIKRLPVVQSLLITSYDNTLKFISEGPDEPIRP
jgi:hypothetical protein